jgi:hypothetical protein
VQVLAHELQEPLAPLRVRAVLEQGERQDGLFNIGVLGRYAQQEFFRAPAVTQADDASAGVE